jgi:3,4-dihydroxy 2-butanone 4-phosphate synthase
MKMSFRAAFWHGSVVRPDSGIIHQEVRMSQNLLSSFGSPDVRVRNALNSLRRGQGILVVDDEDRENEGDLIFSTASLNTEQMALLIRECSGIVCLCLTPEKASALSLSPMVEKNTSPYGTAFTISIEAAKGVSTGVSASDRVTTIRAATADGAKPEDLRHPGHVFPLGVCRTIVSKSTILLQWFSI